MSHELPGVIAILPVVAWTGSALLTAWLAGELGRPGGMWHVLGLVLGPVALVAVGSPGRARGGRVA